MKYPVLIDDEARRFFRSTGASNVRPERVNRTAFETTARHDRFTALGDAAGRQCDALQSPPSKRDRKTLDQVTSTPELAGPSGTTAISASAKISAQRPSEPSFGQLAPPSARRAASASIVNRSAIGGSEQQSAGRREASPQMPCLDGDPEAVEPA